MQLTDDERGPYLMLALDEADTVRARLIEAGIRFEDDPEASQTCAGAVVEVVRFAADADRARIEAVLSSKDS